MSFLTTIGWLAAVLIGLPGDGAASCSPVMPSATAHQAVVHRSDGERTAVAASHGATASGSYLDAETGGRPTTPRLPRGDGKLVGAELNDGMRIRRGRGSSEVIGGTDVHRPLSLITQHVRLQL